LRYSAIYSKGELICETHFCHKTTICDSFTRTSRLSRLVKAIALSWVPTLGLRMRIQLDRMPSLRLRDVYSPIIDALGIEFFLVLTEHLASQCQHDCWLPCMGSNIAFNFAHSSASCLRFGDLSLSNIFMRSTGCTQSHRTSKPSSMIFIFKRPATTSSF
jgi:hypothetical protein